MNKTFNQEIKEILSDDTQRHDIWEKGLLERKIEELSIAMEKMKLAEYVDLLNKPGRLLYINFLSGVARGVGMAIGFALLGAFIIYILQKLLVLNLPVVGELIAEIVKIVQNQLKISP